MLESPGLYSQPYYVPKLIRKQALFSTERTKPQVISLCFALRTYWTLSEKLIEAEGDTLAYPRPPEPPFTIATGSWYDNYPLLVRRQWPQQYLHARLR